MAKPKPADEPKVVEAVGAMAGTVNPRHGSLAKRVEQAMTEAIRDAYAQGITDPVVIRERMMAAREAVKQETKEGK